MLKGFFMEKTNYAELAKKDFTAKEFEDFEERAAILQFDANLSKEEAEKRAYFFIVAG